MENKTKKRYGPYAIRTGHLFYQDIYEDGSRRSVLVHREVMEKHLGRKLAKKEVVHHKDGDPTNNNVSNLEVMSSSDHARLHSLERPRAFVTLRCLQCGCVFSREANKESHNRKQGKKGPYCGKSCAGRASSCVSYGGSGLKKYEHFCRLMEDSPNMLNRFVQERLGISKNTVSSYRKRYKNNGGASAVEKPFGL